jgi:hypothetical protein
MSRHEIAQRNTAHRREDGMANAGLRDSPSEPTDQSQVDGNDSREVVYWCRLFGCTEFQLRRAIDAVGGRVEYVRRYLADGH